jgi:hypothetical protein
LEGMQKPGSLRRSFLRRVGGAHATAGSSHHKHSSNSAKRFGWPRIGAATSFDRPGDLRSPPCRIDDSVV